MPVYSMTGYASRQEAISPAPHADSPPGAARLQLDMRSVNSRFLDITLKLPEELRFLEATACEMLQQHLHRGKVELRVNLEKAPVASTSALPQPEPALLQRLAALQEAVHAWLPQAAPLSVAEILRLTPHQAAAPAPAEALQQRFAATLALLLTNFQQARHTEGEQLAQSLLLRTAQLRVLARQAEPLIPQLVEQQRQRFLEKWQDALQAAAKDSGTAPVSAATAQERALAEATAFALRIDVAEEITRLQSHLDTIEALLRQGGELGKRLEFLIQELHREANTLGSKSASLETSRIAVDMKVLIEQMREQVQNIE